MKTAIFAILLAIGMIAFSVLVLRATSPHVNKQQSARPLDSASGSPAFYALHDPEGQARELKAESSAQGKGRSRRNSDSRLAEASRFDTGVGAFQDFRRAAELLKEFADQNDARACMLYGHMLVDGRGDYLPSDIPEATRYFEKAEMLGHAEARSMKVLSRVVADSRTGDLLREDTRRDLLSLARSGNRLALQQALYDRTNQASQHKHDSNKYKSFWGEARELAKILSHDFGDLFAIWFLCSPWDSEQYDGGLDQCCDSFERLGSFGIPHPLLNASLLILKHQIQAKQEQGECDERLSHLLVEALEKLAVNGFLDAHECLAECYLYGIGVASDFESSQQHLTMAYGQIPNSKALSSLRAAPAASMFGNVQTFISRSPFGLSRQLEAFRSHGAESRPVDLASALISVERDRVNSTLPGSPLALAASSGHFPSQVLMLHIKRNLERSLQKRDEYLDLDLWKEKAVSAGEDLARPKEIDSFLGSLPEGSLRDVSLRDVMMEAGAFASLSLNVEDEVLSRTFAEAGIQRFAVAAIAGGSIDSYVLSRQRLDHGWENLAPGFQSDSGLGSARLERSSNADVRALAPSLPSRSPSLDTYWFCSQGNELKVFVERHRGDIDESIKSMISELSDEVRERLPDLHSRSLSVPASMLGEIQKFSNDIGMEFVRIYSMPFLFKADDSLEYNGKARYAILSRDFEIGMHEVTVKQFARFIAETGYLTSLEDPENHQSREFFLQSFGWVPNWKRPGRFGYYGEFVDDVDAVEDRASHPVSCVSWYDAKAFCEWIGKIDGVRYSLPTEAQWEYVYKDRAFLDTPPWHAYSANAQFRRGREREARLLPSLETFPVKDEGEFHRWHHPLGVSGMGGNVSEWTSDWHDRSELSSPNPEIEVVDPTGPETGYMKVYVGDNFSEPYSYKFRERRSLYPHYGCPQVGFRVVREVLQ